MLLLCSIYTSLNQVFHTFLMKLHQQCVQKYYVLSDLSQIFQPLSFEPPFTKLLQRINYLYHMHIAVLHIRLAIEYKCPHM